MADGIRVTASGGRRVIETGDVRITQRFVPAGDLALAATGSMDAAALTTVHADALLTGWAYVGADANVTRPAGAVLIGGGAHLSVAHRVIYAIASLSAGASLRARANIEGASLTSGVAAIVAIPAYTAGVTTDWESSGAIAASGLLDIPAQAQFNADLSSWSDGYVNRPVHAWLTGAGSTISAAAYVRHSEARFSAPASILANASRETPGTTALASLGRVDNAEAMVIINSAASLMAKSNVGLSSNVVLGAAAKLGARDAFRVTGAGTTRITEDGSRRISSLSTSGGLSAAADLTLYAGAILVSDSGGFTIAAQFHYHNGAGYVLPQSAYIFTDDGVWKRIQ